MSKIPGRPLLGFDDFFDAGDIHLGAVAVVPKTPQPKGARPATPVKTLPVGKGVTKFVKVTARKGKPSGKPSPHKLVLVRSIDAGKRAVEAGKRAGLSVKNYTANVKKGQHGPIVPVKPTRVNGDGTVVLGATTARVLSPQQKAAVGKHVKAVAKNAAATRRLDALAKRAQTIGTGALAYSKGAALAIKKAFAPKWKTGPTRIRGIYDYTALGLSPPDPNSPGFLMDGTLDPAMADPTVTDPYAAAPDPYASMDDGSGAVYGPSGEVLYDPATDPAVVPMPVRGGTLSADEASTQWQNVPEDGIAYDGSYGLPQNGVGSWNVFFGVSGKSADGQWGIPGFLRGADEQGAIRWMFNDGKDNVFHVAPNEYQSTATSGAPECKGVSANSLARGWGPIVGNPRDPKLAGLQYAIADGVWFWQGQYAPAWATTEADSKIAGANAKVIAANRVTALVEAARLAKDLAAQQEAQAKQDAANALAMSAADTQSQIMQMQVDSQQGQLDMQMQKAELDLQVQQSGLDLQQQMQQGQIDMLTQKAILEDAQRQAALDAEAQHSLIDQANVWNTWAKENPAEAVAQMQQQGGGGGGEYEDDGANGSSTSAYGDPFENYDGGTIDRGTGGSYDFENGGDEGDYSGDPEGD